ncbi:uncharacterized protein TRIADDRAFT_57690 [Trichoplax adhaerens]|uniref:TOG domain-containing protein n=1 Tax=Trichoplax adhaerens TaxID=10228 RepID=B3S055_TRIAD|nr:hypothetical protein TRIADDRAFT_57690 [Trichoplax adhaerens]EDV23945.1 hypothetical protein TRIADDRAFT_57690 [Trichoplax adhaerens]|eukprot:XP_002113471.1 hypothetical protein TRIADDRAFT_57690 [Trichoplax adhaerens]
MPKKISFQVVHSSGSEEGYLPGDLEAHSPYSKGWQSSRFCVYPQELIIQFERKIQLSKVQFLSHHFLIASKVELFIGGSGNDNYPWHSSSYTRLGYITLSDNATTGYKARELKSVFLEGDARFIKILLHKNHVNKYNLYNQVGMVAVNVLGDFIDDGGDGSHLNDYNTISLRNKVNNAFNDPLKKTVRIERLSPSDDLVFDSYQDAEISKLVRKLDDKKHDAVLAERYEYAKKLKYAISELQKAADRLGRYEMEKRRAIEIEDYDSAKAKKITMDEYRLQVYRELNLRELLELQPNRTTDRSMLDNVMKESSEAKTQNQDDQDSVSSVKPEERPPRPVVLTPIAGQTNTQASDTYESYDSKPLPAVQKKSPEKFENDKPLHTEEEPEPLTDKQLREASDVLDVLGLDIVKGIYSRNWSIREKSFLNLSNKVRDSEAPIASSDSKEVVRGCIFALKKGTKDNVFSVYSRVLELMRILLTQYMTKANSNCSKPEFANVVEKILPLLILKTGETAVRLRTVTMDFILEIAKYPEIQPPRRLAESRIELLASLHKEFGLGKKSGMTISNMMNFLNVCLDHTAGEVRDGAIKSIFELYKVSGNEVRKHLPPDEPNIRKSTKYRIIFEGFDKIDGKPTAAELKKQAEAAEKDKQKEIQALKAQLNQLKQMTNAQQQGDPNLAQIQEAESNDSNNLHMPQDTDKSADRVNKSRNRSKSKLISRRSSHRPEDTASVATMGTEGDQLGLEKTCIFCGEVNENFSEQGLDIHYWKSCPMLMKCQHCTQVVEISNMNDHLTSECESKEKFTNCPTCGKAVLSDTLQQHENSSDCIKSEKPLCYLCRLEIENDTDEAWKAHLMESGRCEANKRRLDKNKEKKPKTNVKKSTNNAKPANTKSKPTNLNTKGNNAKIKKDTKDAKPGSTRIK